MFFGIREEEGEARTRSELEELGRQQGPVALCRSVDTWIRSIYYIAKEYRSKNQGRSLKNGLLALLDSRIRFKS